MGKKHFTKQHTAFHWRRKCIIKIHYNNAAWLPLHPISAGHPKPHLPTPSLQCSSVGQPSLPPGSASTLQTTGSHHSTFSKMGMWFWSLGRAFHSSSGEKAPAEHTRTQGLSFTYLSRLISKFPPQPGTAALSVRFHAAVHTRVSCTRGLLSGLEVFSHQRTQSLPKSQLYQLFSQQTCRVTHPGL